MNIELILTNFGLNEKETAVYLALIELGPSPVRVLAQKSGVNRGTTYDILKSLIDLGLITYYNTKTHQYFSAEPPEKLILALEERQEKLLNLKEQIKTELPELKLLYEKKGGKPAIKLFEGMKGIKSILEDVIEVMSKCDEKIYYVYSSSLRKDVYTAYPAFSEIRKKQSIFVKTISLEKGGQLVGMDERKWLHKTENMETIKNSNETYEIIYSGKTAHISLDNTENPVGVIIQNQAIYETQKIIFETLWGKI